MNKNTLIASALVVGVTVAAALRFNTYINMLEARFPYLDRKTIRKAFRTFLKNGYNQQYGDMQDLNDEQMDAIFLDIVRTQTDTN